MTVMLWILYLGTLSSFQHEFKGTLAECQMHAYQIMQTEKSVKAGCYKVSKRPPYRRYYD